MVNPGQAVAFVVGITLLGYCQGQTNAERDGTVVARIFDMDISEFPGQEMLFRETIAVYASQYCKRWESNCRTSDKQIRYNDVIVANFTVVVAAAVDVKVYVRDRFDNERAGLDRWELKAAMDDYSQEIEDDFLKMVDVIDPVFTGLEDWEIALIAVGCFIFLVIIITVPIVETKKKKKKKAKAEERSISSRSSSVSSVRSDVKQRMRSHDLDHGKEPPVYVNVVAAKGNRVTGTPASNVPGRRVSGNSDSTSL